MISPARLASAVVHRKKIMAPAVILPVVRAFPILEIPMMIEQKDHHVQGIHVNASDQTGDSKYRFEPACQKKSGKDTKDQADKDCCGNMLFIPRIEIFH